MTENALLCGMVRPLSKWNIVNCLLPILCICFYDDHPRPQFCHFARPARYLISSDTACMSDKASLPIP